MNSTQKYLAHQLRSIRQASTETSISEATFRWWIFNEKENGFDRCIVRVGRSVYIDMGALDEWLESQRAIAG